MTSKWTMDELEAKIFTLHARSARADPNVRCAMLGRLAVKYGVLLIILLSSWLPV